MYDRTQLTPHALSSRLAASTFGLCAAVASGSRTSFSLTSRWRGADYLFRCVCTWRSFPSLYSRIVRLPSVVHSSPFGCKANSTSINTEMCFAIFSRSMVPRSDLSRWYNLTTRGFWACSSLGGTCDPSLLGETLVPAALTREDEHMTD